MGLNKTQLATEIAESSQALMDDLDADAAAADAAAEEKELLASDTDEKMAEK